jgi:type IV pilus assembly protein PilY1
MVMWEFSDTDDVVNTDAENAANPGGLGYVLSQPVIRRMANGRWAAIVSGGYNNFEPDGAQPSAPDVKASAYLYILFLEGPTGPGGRWIHGTDYIRIDTRAGTANAPNGLAQPFAADVDSDGYVDFIYAGDVLGNMWKIDVSAATAGQPAGSTAIDPLAWMQTRNIVKLYSGNQPITSQAVGTLHPTGRGFIIAFGTGKYLEPEDTLGTFETQSYYGIWDKNDSPGNIAGQTIVDRSLLFEQIVTNVSASTGVYRSVDPRSGPGTAPDWNRNTGWFLDFPRSSVTGERAVFDPMLVAGRLIFTSLIPSGGACEFGGTSFLMVLNPVTGGRFQNAVLDVNGADSTGRVVIDNTDKLSTGVFASGVQSAVGITPTPTVTGGRSIESSGSATVGIDGTTLVRTSGTRRGNMIFHGSAPAAGSGGGPTGIDPNHAIELPVGLAKDYGRVVWREVLRR